MHPSQGFANAFGFVESRHDHRKIDFRLGHWIRNAMLLSIRNILTLGSAMFPLFSRLLRLDEKSFLAIPMAGAGKGNSGGEQIFAPPSKHKKRKKPKSTQTTKRKTNPRAFRHRFF